MKSENNVGFYEQQRYTTLEYASLAEDLEFSTIEDTMGKFFVKVMTPSVETEEIEVKKVDGIESQNFVELIIPAYMLLSFVGKIRIQQLRIKHVPDKCPNCPVVLKHKILNTFKYQFFVKKAKYVIPKGTVFLITFIGGELKLNNIVIVGVAPQVKDAEEAEEPEYEGEE